MKPYGMKRDPELQYPDVNTIKTLGLKSSLGYVKPSRKSKARRIQKRAARLEGKQAAKVTDL